jgi:hypothetical protein
MIHNFRPDLFCLQETKLGTVNNAVIMNVAGQEYEDNYFFLSADGTRGGILISSCDSSLQLQQSLLSDNTITVTVIDIKTNAIWTATGVWKRKWFSGSSSVLRDQFRLPGFCWRTLILSIGPRTTILTT